MENLNKKINDNYKLVNELPDDAKHLPKFLASCKRFFATINPYGDEEIIYVIDFLKQKLHSNIFLNFQEKHFNSLEEFENGLKDHYMQKISSFSFYFNILSLKQKQNETVCCFANRLKSKKNEFLFQDNQEF